MTNDPKADPQSEVFQVVGPILLNVPPMREVPKLESFVYEGSPRRTEGESASAASPGDPGGADPEVIRSEYTLVPRRAPARRFAELIELLPRLERTGAIEGWRIVRPPRAGIEFDDGAVAWPFLARPDPKRPWCYIDRDDERVRGAIVCEIDLGGATVHWLEIETRGGTEKFRAVLFRAEPGERALIIESVMRIAERVKGVWPRPDSALAEEVGADSMRAWKHWYEGDQSGRLSKESALRALRAVAHA